MKTLLTKREVAVTQLVCRQYQSKEIAQELQVSNRSIDGYRTDIFKKVKCRTVVGLVVYALRNGLLNMKDWYTQISAITETPVYMEDKIYLTPKEISIIRLLCNEYSNEEVGKKMKISKRTVEGIRLRILKKTECRSVVGLLFFAIKNGIYEL